MGRHAQRRRPNRHALSRAPTDGAGYDRIVKCRKCGSNNEAGAWVCRKCEYILDSSFLGADILNEKTRDGDVDDEPPALPAQDLGGDALILGRLDDGDVESFVTDRTGSFLPSASAEQKQAPRSVYLTGEVRVLVLPDSVLRHTADAHDRRHVLSPFEDALFELIDGESPLHALQELAGISDHDLCVTVAMLHDKALVEKVPAAKARPPRLPIAMPPLPDESREESLDDHTRELADLPPLAPSSQASPLPSSSPSSPSPSPSSQSPSSARPSRSPFDEPDDDPLPDGSLTPPMRPALRPPMKSPAAPAPKPASPAMPPSSGLRMTPAASGSPAAQPLATATSAGKKRAVAHYEVCMKELNAGRMGRAWGYAKMAADAEPGEEKYQMLLRDWDKLHGAHGDRASTPQELMAAAQEAEANGDIDKAVEQLRKLLAAAPSSAAAHNKLAVLLATRMKDFRAAYDEAIKAVELEPGNMSYQSNMMKILTRVDADEKKRGDTGEQGIFSRFLRR